MREECATVSSASSARPRARCQRPRCGARPLRAWRGVLHEKARTSGASRFVLSGALGAFGVWRCGSARTATPNQRPPSIQRAARAQPGGFFGLGGFPGGTRAIFVWCAVGRWGVGARSAVCRRTAPAVENFAWLPVGLAPAKLNCSSVSVYKQDPTWVFFFRRGHPGSEMACQNDQNFRFGQKKYPNDPKVLVL